MTQEETAYLSFDNYYHILEDFFNQLQPKIIQTKNYNFMVNMKKFTVLQEPELKSYLSATISYVIILESKIFGMSKFFAFKCLSLN